MTAPLGVILAGGRATRMGGGDKGLLPFGAGVVLDAVIDRLSPQVADLALNANGDPARFARYGLPVLPDPVPDHPGPLAGVLAAMIWARAQGAIHVVTLPADTPFAPCDLVPRLLLAAEETGIAVASSAGRLHPTCALWPVALADDLRAALAAGQRKVMDFARQHGAAEAAFDAGPPDPFMNINTPGDLVQAQDWL